MNKRLTFLTCDDYNYIVQNEKAPIVMFFEAKWDDNSNNMLPFLSEIANDYYEKVKIYGCDIDDLPLCAAKSNITNIPSLVIFKDGVEVGRCIGFKEKSEVEVLLKKHEVI